MQVLVTGGAGFIGSHLSERLLAQGHHVRVLDNLSTGKRENLPSVAGLELVEGDIRDVARVRLAVADCDAIVHLAAVASVQASIDDSVGTHETNFMGTLNLLEAARRAGVRRFLYASSAAVYGDTAERPVSEDAPVRPLSPYASDKLCGEHYLSFYERKYGISGTAFRFFNIYGPRQDPSSPYSGVISIFVDRAKCGESVVVFGDGEQTRDFVYVGDLVEILCAAIDTQSAGGQVLNVGRGIEGSLNELLSELEVLFGRAIKRRYEPARIGDIRNSCANIDRLRQTLSRSPQTTLTTGLAQLIRSLG